MARIPPLVPPTEVHLPQRGRMGGSRDPGQCQTIRPKKITAFSEFSPSDEDGNYCEEDTAHTEILDAEVQLPNPGAQGGGLVGWKECLAMKLRKCPNLLGIRAGRKDGGGCKPNPV